MYTRYLGILALSCAGFAQAPAFEVASVRRAEPLTPAMVQSGRVKIGVSIDELNVRISQFSLFDLTTLAYQIKPHQLSAPGWMATERYDIQARLPEGRRRADVPAMLQTLLAERFGMKIHRETRDFDVYALVVTKGGPNMITTSVEPTTASSAEPLRAGVAVANGGSMSASVGGGGNWRVTPDAHGNLHVETTNMTMAMFANFINRYCDRPVVEATGLTGRYDAALDISGEEMREAARAHGAVIPPPRAADAAPADAASDPGGVSLISSLRRLGLRLETRKAPAEVIVVDQVQKQPTEN